MFTRGQPREPVWYRCMFFLGMITLSSNAQQSASRVLDRVEVSDVAVLQRFTLTVRLEQTVSSDYPEQGTLGKKCTVTKTTTGIAVVCEVDRLPTLVYRPLGTGKYSPREYDANGNLYINIPSSHVALCDAERNDRYFEYESFSVDPAGRATSTGRFRTLHRYPLADAWIPPSEMKHIWWALGQDLQPSFRRVERAVSLADGTAKLRIRGVLDRGHLEGNWDVATDPASEHLVRSAVFQIEALSYPSLEVQTRGLRRFGTLALPEEGFVRFTFGGVDEQLHKGVFLQDFSEHANNRLFESALDTLNRSEIGIGLTIYDYRTNPSQPVVTRN